jgi:hypothetical protein
MLLEIYERVLARNGNGHRENQGEFGFDGAKRKRLR